MSLNKEDTQSLLNIVWRNSESHKIHGCVKKMSIDIYDFDGRTLWVNALCKCGVNEKLEFQLINVSKGKYKDDETGPVIIKKIKVK